ncbi:bacterioferritin [Massilia sp. H6]|uniref:ferritin-like domain-containing protein n=1 Tax=Massilia sp. H6 TaxID=2970464 RepID=UPI002168514D|nr:ferritin-like domain-containing protein [Massilia sp. H6]UVW30140.1 ferritin-like domain-containing protein [Massilia sp. H6]
MEETKNLAHGFDIAAIRRAAANLDDGAVTEGYQADREAVIAMLNDALATELLCVLRYKRHYFTVSGPNTGHIKAEFLEHAQQEQDHADRIAERIVQLNGSPNFNPATLTARSHAEYDDSDDVQAMVRADLIAERVAIESYRQMILAIGDKDPTTRAMLVDIMAVEEEHADDMADLMS